MPKTPKRGASPRISEAHIEQACTQILQIDGWRAFKMEQNFSEKKQKSVGESGMPDRLYIRYWDYPPKRGGGEILWIEWKRLDGKKATVTSQAQKDWILIERSRGALLWVAGEDFPSTIEGFREFYKTSGCMIHKILT